MHSRHFVARSRRVCHALGLSLRIIPVACAPGTSLRPGLRRIYRRPGSSNRSGPVARSVFCGDCDLSPPVIGVLAAELISAFQSFFGHANAILPGRMEKPLRRLFVTPDMHRIHHSEEVGEQSRNFGDIFPWWDHLFQTYLAEPAAGQEGTAGSLKRLPLTAAADHQERA